MTDPTNTQSAGDQINQNQNKQVLAYSVKLPPFWATQPEVWFYQVETQFSLAKISSDRTKYDYIIASLPADILSVIFDVVKNPPDSNLYTNLKNKIIQRLTSSEEKRLDVLLSNIEVGDRKPSEFYRDMMALAGGSSMVSQELLLKLWKRHLPKPISLAITTTGKSQTDEILDIADKIWDTYKTSDISSVNVNPTITKKDSLSENLLKSFSDLSLKCSQTLETLAKKNYEIQIKVETLQSEISSLKQNSTNQNQNFSNSHNNCYCRSRSRSRSRSRFDSDVPICYYHKRFKEKANKCSGKWCLLYKTLDTNNSKN